MNSLKSFLTPNLLSLKAIIVLFILYFGYEVVSFLVIDFPYNMYEPEVVMDAWAVSQGQELYPARTEGPIAGLYAPLYHVVVAFFFTFLPDSLSIARLVSVLSLGIIIVLFRKTTMDLPYSWVWSLLAVSLWHDALLTFDLHAKPDSFSVMLGLSAIYVLYENQAFRHLMYAALLASLAVAAKQSMAFIPVAIGFYFLIERKWKNLVQFSLFFLLISTGIWSAFFYTLGPDMYFYVFIQPGTFTMNWAGTVINFWLIQHNLIWLSSLLLVVMGFKRNELTSKIKLLGSLASWALPACVLTASKGGGMVNAYQPFLYSASWLFLVLIGHHWNTGLRLSEWFRVNRLLASSIILLMLFFTAMPNFPSMILSVPQRIETYLQYNELADTLRKNEGTVYVPMDNYLSLKVGKPLRWSYKWQIETPLRKPNRPEKDHTSIAMESDWVVTVKNNDWTSDTRLESVLEKNGFSKVQEYPVTISQTYRLWKKNSLHEYGKTTPNTSKTASSL